MSKMIFERSDAPAHIEERLQRMERRTADLVAAVSLLAESADREIAERVALLLDRPLGGHHSGTNATGQRE